MIAPAPRPDAQPLDLPRLDPATLAASNALCRHREPVALASVLGALSVAPAAPADLDAWTGTWARIAFTSGDREGALWLPRDLVSAGLRTAYPDIDLDRLGPDGLALAAEAAERGLVDALAKSARAPLEIVGIEPAEGAPTGVAASLLVTCARSVFPVAITCHPIERERILRTLAARPVRRLPFRDLVVPVAFRVGYTLLTLDDYAELAVGGGVVLDDTTLGFQKILAIVAERFAQSCTWQTVKPVLDGPLLKRLDPTTTLYATTGFIMDHADSTGQPPATGSLSDVPVHLVFEIGRTEIPVHHLESLKESYVFDLAKPLSQMVEIIANGRRIGAGELVRLGDTIGVRVTKLVR